MKYEIDKSLKIRPQKAEKKPKKDEGLDMLLLAKYSSLGYYLVAPLLVGIFIGYALDQYFKTKPTLTLIFIGFGFISSMYNLVKMIKEEQQRHDATRKH